MLLFSKIIAYQFFSVVYGSEHKPTIKINKAKQVNLFFDVMYCNITKTVSFIIWSNSLNSKVSRGRLNITASLPESVGAAFLWDFGKVDIAYDAFCTCEIWSIFSRNWPFCRVLFLRGIAVSRTLPMQYFR